MESHRGSGMFALIGVAVFFFLMEYTSFAKQLGAMFGAFETGGTPTATTTIATTDNANAATSVIHSAGQIANHSVSAATSDQTPTSSTAASVG